MKFAIFCRSLFSIFAKATIFGQAVVWELVDSVVADSVMQDNDKTNNIQIETRKLLIKVLRGRGQDFPIFKSCRYQVELGPRQLGLPVAE